MSTSTSRHPGGTLRLRPREQALPPSTPALTPESEAVSPTPPDPAEIAARKQANVQREREAHAAAVVRRREQTREVLAVLHARWPAAFSTPVPLAIGVAYEIKLGLGETRIPAARLNRALHFWTHGSGYLIVLADGHRRVHLDGSDAGEPDEVARQHARDILAQRAAQRRTC
jgi:hypothetical protein